MNETKNKDSNLKTTNKNPGLFDEITNSSILEFLNQEQQCDYDNTSELDVESLFDEINRLSDDTDDRSVDEILREAELLLKHQSFDGLSLSIGNNINPCDLKCENNLKEGIIPKKIRDNCISQSDSTIYHKFDNREHTELDLPHRVKKTETKIKTINNKSKQPIEEHCEKEESKPMMISSSPQSSRNLIKRNSLDKINEKENICMTTKKVNNNSIDTHSSLLKEKSISNNNIFMSSPSHSVAASSFPWTRERALEKEIEELQEKLKDTEERFQSLRLQHDSLSQQHRELKENQSQFQEDTEKLKLEVQHLSECANVLRNELQNARTDRNDALDVQKVLQIDLNDSRSDRKRLLDQTEKDGKIIQDLQRQCREMERILMRKHPDSVSALIVASKTSSNQKEDSSSSRRLLEQRITQLESDAREQDAKAQQILANVQAKFTSVQSKYETHIADLETQVLSLQEINSKLNEKLTTRIEEIEKYRIKSITKSCSSQTDDIAEHESINRRHIGSQTENKTIINKTPVNGLKKPNKITNSYSETTINQNNIKEDAHLLATIRGMRVDLAIKEKAMQRLTREVDECKKTIKKLQKERDTYLKSDKPGSNISAKKVYDPSMYSEQSADRLALKEAHNKIKLLEFDYKSLHEKRLQDLKTLQAAHERELASCHETVRILQERLVEKDETASSQKRRRVPIDYYALKAKVSSLEKRHSEREDRLHMLVEALSKGRLNGELEQAINDVPCFYQRMDK